MDPLLLDSFLTSNPTVIKHTLDNETQECRPKYLMSSIQTIINNLLYFKIERFHGKISPFYPSNHLLLLSN